jgi:hypothetical protein
LRTSAGDCLSASILPEEKSTTDSRWPGEKVKGNDVEKNVLLGGSTIVFAAGEGYIRAVPQRDNPTSISLNNTGGEGSVRP